MHQGQSIQFMHLALQAALKSPDPSTQNGALLTDQWYKIWPETFACNEFPKGMEYTPERWERPLKYSIIEHAERNAIYAAAKSGRALSHATMVAPWAACADCARAIVQAGISRLVMLERESDASLAHTDRWGDTISIGDEILKAGGVQVQTLGWEHFTDIAPLRRNGILWRPGWNVEPDRAMVNQEASMVESDSVPA